MRGLSIAEVIKKLTPGCCSEARAREAGCRLCCDRFDAIDEIRAWAADLRAIGDAVVGCEVDCPEPATPRMFVLNAIAGLRARAVLLDRLRAVATAYREVAETPRGHLDTIQDLARDDLDKLLAELEALAGPLADRPRDELLDDARALLEWASQGLSCEPGRVAYVVGGLLERIGASHG